jgi:hypothetical protein
LGKQSKQATRRHTACWLLYLLAATRPIFENERLFLNYALAVAASYAVKRRLDFVVFSKVRPI